VDVVLRRKSSYTDNGRNGNDFGSESSTSHLISWSGLVEGVSKLPVLVIVSMPPVRLGRGDIEALTLPEAVHQKD
jgi:hypothetical protein